MQAAASPRLLASPAIRALLRRRLAELGGIALGLGGVGLLVALFCYNPQDPSLNTASSQHTTNLAGPGGAVTADLLLQGFGVAAALPALAMLAWAWRIASHRGLGSFAARLASTLAALPVIAAVAAALPMPSGAAWPTTAGPGGAIGGLLARLTIGWGRTLAGPFGAGGAWCIGVALALLLVWASFGLSAGEWRAAGSVVRGGVKTGRRAASWLPRFSMPAWFRRAAPPEAPLSALTRAVPALDPVPAVRTPRARPEPASRSEQAAPVAAPVPRAKITASVRKPLLRQESLPLNEPAPGGWRLPPVSLLTQAPARASVGPSEDALQANARLLESVLDEYGVQGVIREIRPGPVVTLYELEPAPGIRSARVIGLADDVARSLCVTAVRIATVPGRNVIGIEVPNAKRETVYLSELLGAEAWDRNQSKLALALGKDIGGEPVLADLARMPHLLVAGTTGVGQVRRHQRDDPEPAIPAQPRPVPDDPDRPEDAGAVCL